MTGVKAHNGSKISTQHQITLPVAALRAAGLSAGQRVVARADGPGRSVLERVDDVLARYRDTFSGLFGAGDDVPDLEELRDEWD